MSLFSLPAIKWGANFQNTLQFGYKMDNPLLYSEPRPGTETVQTPSGIEDAWWLGDDFVLEADFRWIGLGPTATASWDGVVGVRAMISWAGQKNKVRFIPDQTNPGNYVDAYIYDQDAGTAPTQEPDGTFRRRLKLRQPTRAFSQVCRGLLLEYVPGQGLPTGWSFVRGGVAYYFGPDGKLKTAQANVLRENDPPDQPSLAGVSAWTEGAATNLDENNDYETDVLGAHGNGGATVTQDNNPLGTSALSGSYCCRVDIPNVAGSGLFKSKRDGTRFPCVVGGFYVGSHYVYVPPGSGLVGQQVNVIVEFWTALSCGTQISTPSSLQTIKAGWNRYWFGAVAPATAVGCYYDWYVAAAPGASYSVWTELNQFERQDNIQMPTSPILSSTVGGTSRAAEQIFAPWAYPPLAGWVYRKWVERSAGTNSGFPTKWILGDNATGAHRWYGYRGASGNYGHAHVATTTATEVVTNQASPANYGDTVEAVYGFYADGSIDLRVRVNGGVEFYSGRTTALIGGMQDKWGDAVHSTVDLCVSGGEGGQLDADELLAFKYGVGTPPASIAAAAAV